MEDITTNISFLLLVGLVLSPILILLRLNKSNIRYKFVSYLIISIIITASITWIFAWWSYISDIMLLAHYGYNIDGMNAKEFYGHVAAENMERVKSLEKNIMGIGWPLKAILSYVIYMPYLLLVYLITYVIRKNRKRTTHTSLLPLRK